MDKLLRAINDPNSSLDEITVLVSGDASLTAQLLRLSNTALFSQAGEISNVEEAIGTVGLNYLKTALFTGAVSRLQLKQTPALTLVRNHSMATGVAMLAIAKQLGRSDMDQLFLYAILHRLGQFVLLFHPRTKHRYEDVLAHIRRHQVPYGNAEIRVLGITHSWLGGMLAQHWNFPLEFVHILLPYEKGGDGDDQDLDHICELVRLADQVAMASGQGTPEGYPIDEDAILHNGCEIGIFPSENPMDLERFMEDMMSQWAAARALWPA